MKIRKSRPRYLTVKVASEQFGLRLNTIYGVIYSKRLPAKKIKGI